MVGGKGDIAHWGAYNGLIQLVQVFNCISQIIDFSLSQRKSFYSSDNPSIPVTGL